MTNEEAIMVLNMVEAHGLADEAKKIAVSALEKQIQKKPLSAKQMWKIDPDVVIGGYGMYSFKDKWCPTCHKHIIKDSDGNIYHKGYNVAIYGIGYCSCGQKIDWSEVD